jgi:hypothetical protein
VASHFEGIADLAVVPSDRDAEAAVAGVGAIDLEHGVDPMAVLGYMPSAETVDPYMTGLQWSRRFAGLKVFLSLVTLDGRPAIRACITSYRTNETTIASLRNLLIDARASSPRPEPDRHHPHSS